MSQEHATEFMRWILSTAAAVVNDDAVELPIWVKFWTDIDGGGVAAERNARKLVEAMEHMYEQYCSE